MARGIVTGSTFRNQELEFTSLKDLNVQGRSAPGDGTAPPNLYEQLNTSAAQLKGELHHALPAHRTLLRVVDLPSDDAEEIEGMVDLKIDQIAPFPVDHMYVTHEVLSEEDGISRVLIVAAQKKWIDHAGDSFKEAGLDLTRVDVDILGWLHLLKTSDRLPERGRHLLLMMDKSGSELLLVEDGVPLGFRSLGIKDEDESDSEFMEDLVEEMEYSLTSLEGEWGGDPVQSLLVWHRGEAPYALERLGLTAGVPMRSESLETLGPLSEGVAMRAVSANKSGRAIADLAPEEWVEAIKDKSAKRGLYMAALAMLSLFLLYLMGVILFTRYQANQLEQVTAEAQALKEPSDEVYRLSKNVRFLKEFTSRDRSALETLKRMTDDKPKPIGVRAMSYKKRDNLVTLKGNAADQSLVNQWIDKLSNSGHFDVPPDKTRRTKSRQGGWDFNFEAHLNDGEDSKPALGAGGDA